METNKIYKFKTSPCRCQFLIMKYSFGVFFLKDKQGKTSIHTDPKGIKMCPVKLGIIKK